MGVGAWPGSSRHRSERAGGIAPLASRDLRVRELPYRGSAPRASFPRVSLDRAPEGRFPRRRRDRARQGSGRRQGEVTPMHRPIPDLIQWHEGLLLTPQHFQQLSQRTESLVQALPSWYVPFYWGVRRFEYDRTALTAGVLTVRELDAVMPDGLHVFATDRDNLQLDLRPLATGFRQNATLVHLAMPIANGQSHTVVNRFRSYEGEPVADENTCQATL